MENNNLERVVDVPGLDESTPIGQTDSIDVGGTHKSATITYRRVAGGWVYVGESNVESSYP